MKKEISRVSRALKATGIAAAALLTPATTLANDDSSLEFSGFARVIAGYLDTDKAYFEGYEDELSLTEKSLVGFQADYALTDKVSLSGQLLLHSNSDFQSGLEWLYLSYEPTSDWQLKVGRLRTPYLKYSDVFDVGYAYPWISAPRQLYGTYLFFPRYEGANLRYRFNIKDVYIDVEGYYGEFTDNIIVNGESFHVNAKDMYGGIIEANYQGWQFRVATFDVASVRAGAAGLDELRDGLQLAGFPTLAEYFSINGSTEAILYGMTYDSLDWFATAEYVDVESDIPILAGIQNYYVTVGKYFGEYQLLLTYAKANQSLTQLDNTIPSGVDPFLDLLSSGVDQAAARFPTDVLDSVTVTARWDFSPGVAFKAEVSFLNGESDKTSLFQLKPDSDDFDRKAVLYQVGVEWVF